MTRSMRFIWVLAALVPTLSGGDSACDGRFSAEEVFLRELDPCFRVAFTTSLIGGLLDDKERQTLQRADEISADVMVAYVDHSHESIRWTLAWLLITQESTAYVDFARRRIGTTPWQEARIWRCRFRDRSLSDSYRAQLRDLLLNAPNSEARTFAAAWHASKGDRLRFEDASYDVMRQDVSWDAVDAAHDLRFSTRYREAAARRLLQLLSRRETFDPDAARRLFDFYGTRDELRDLRLSPISHRRATVIRLQSLIESEFPQVSVEPASLWQKRR